MSEKKEQKNSHLSHKQVQQKKLEDKLRANLMRRKAQEKERQKDDTR